MHSYASLLLTAGNRRPARYWRGYLEVGAAGLTGNLLYAGSRFRAASPAGVAFTSGAILSEHLAFQFSPSLLWSSGATDGDGTPGGATTGSYRTQVITIPALLRYTLTASCRRLHLDGLGGFTLLFADTRRTYPSAGSSVAKQVDYNESSIQVGASFGPALRYTLLPQLELVTSAPVSLVLANSAGSLHDRLLLQVLAEAHYTFGAR